MSTQHPNLSHVTPDQHHPKLHHANHQTGGSDVVTVTEAELSFTDVTTADASTSKHGLVKKLPNDATKYYDGTGNYSVPAGGGGSSPILTADVQLTNEQILNRVGSPVALLPPPGDGLMYRIWDIDAVFDILGAYTGTNQGAFYGGAVDHSRFYGASSIAFFLNTIGRNVLTSMIGFGDGGVATAYGDISLFNNQAVIFGPVTGDTDEFGGGDPRNTISLRIYYSLLPTTPFGGA